LSFVPSSRPFLNTITAPLSSNVDSSFFLPLPLDPWNRQRRDTGTALSGRSALVPSFYAPRCTRPTTYCYARVCTRQERERKNRGKWEEPRRGRVPEKRIRSPLTWRRGAFRVRTHAFWPVELHITLSKRALAIYPNVSKFKSKDSILKWQYVFYYFFCVHI